MKYEGLGLTSVRQFQFIRNTVVEDFECSVSELGGRMDKTNPVTSNNRYILEESVTTLIDQ